MATKTKDEVPVTNSNINTNNINVNVNVKRPKVVRKRTPKKEEKPNWILKAIVIGIISLALPFIWSYVKDAYEGGKAKSPAIYGGTPIQGKKVK
jgi:hypothetical protein